LAFVLLLVGAGGCGGDDALNSPTAVRMRGLANMYLDHVVGKGAPANEEALKKHMRAQMDFTLTGYNLDPKNIDAAFVSDRDHEPLVVMYGMAVSGITGDSKQVVAHEKTGTNGKRLVVFLSTKVDYVDEAELERLKNAEQKK
jgi:hypothetical protein